MQDVVSSVARRRQPWVSFVASRVRAEAPGLTDVAASLLTAILLILSFPNFELWILAWIAVIPLLLAIMRRPLPLRSFILGWASGTVFFYGSCYWLTYSMINYGGLPSWLAFLLLLPGALILGLFPGAFALFLSLVIRTWGHWAILFTPLFWVSLEWTRLESTGQLWNAIGYSQAYQPSLIQIARWGGVYAVGFLIMTVNTAIALLIYKRSRRAVAVSFGVVVGVALVISLTNKNVEPQVTSTDSPEFFVVALQPNVPMDLSISTSELEQLLAAHIEESSRALAEVPIDSSRLVIWPESPMNFAYGNDAEFQQLLSQFTKQNHTALLFNSLEQTPESSAYNSAVLINDGGRAIARYDKIRLMPFGEYVPLPGWLPGASLVRAIVGDFTPGSRYTLIPAGGLQAGVFICIEAAYPWIARRFSAEGAELLINISNDGYLGPTAVMRQHLANAIFRAVENGKPLLRVTNSGITAFITPAGQAQDQTPGFQRTFRVWKVPNAKYPATFYSRHGDVFAITALVATIIAFLLTLVEALRGAKKQLRG